MDLFCFQAKLTLFVTEILVERANVDPAKIRLAELAIDVSHNVLARGHILCLLRLIIDVYDTFYEHSWAEMASKFSSYSVMCLSEVGHAFLALEPQDRAINSSSGGNTHWCALKLSICLSSLRKADARYHNISYLLIRARSYKI